MLNGEQICKRVFTTCFNILGRVLQFSNFPANFVSNPARIPM
jgi:hypothetical protein